MIIINIIYDVDSECPQIYIAMYLNYTFIPIILLVEYVQSAGGIGFCVRVKVS